VALPEPAYWIGFSRVSGIGAKRIARLLEVFPTLEAAWRADESALAAAQIEPGVLAKLRAAKSQLDLAAEYERVRKLGARVVTLVDPTYPALLRTLHDAPSLLYVLGDLTPEDAKALAVVGTRKATKMGLAAAHDLSRALGAQGVTIISGLAHGIDTAAHQGALAGGGRTIAVLGCGIDRVYPPENAALARKIATCGALVTEFAVGTPPDGRNFPRRNRVVSGLALGVLVVEAPENSGALITASVAADQGRDVFAVPASIYNPIGAGANRLIQDGAKLVMQAEDILDELNIAHEFVQTTHKAEQVLPANPVEAQVLAALSADPIHIDELVRACGLPVGTVSGTLVTLELKGLAQSSGHMQYSLAYP
jgi:DNA processing protein